MARVFAGGLKETGQGERALSPLVLLIEDESPILVLLESYLIEKGCRTLTAASIEEARELWNSNKQEINAVITDLRLQGSSGLNLGKSFKSERPNLHLFIITGLIPEESKNMEGVHWVAKPFRFGNFIDDVTAIIGNSPRMRCQVN